MKKEYPLVSVAIITYNQKEYLKECIESILSQDYPNIEIVVADDASTDGTQEMLQEYKEKYPKKFVLELAKKNLGITKNSNKAHFACSGKYIAWMGGDDLMLPKKITKQVQYMESNPDCTICYHNLEVFNSDTKQVLYYFNEQKKYEGNVRTQIKYGTFNGACSNMVRAIKTPKNGFDERIPIASDWMYWVETLSNGGTINYIDEVLGKYRRHKNNITNKNNNNINNSLIDHINTINILLAKYPQYKESINYRASKLYRDLRYKLDYELSLKLSLAYRLNLKSFLGLLVYIISLKRIKL